MLTGLKLAIVLLTCPGLIAKEMSSSLDNLTKDGVVPDVIDAQPEKEIKVEWSPCVRALQGNELTPTQVQNQPDFEFDADPDSLYTLAMVDPDAPSREDPSLSELLHFMVANIPGQDVSKGDMFAEYIGAGPPKGTGLHRYVILLLKQGERLPSDLMHIKKNNQGDRTKFSIREFAKKHNLEAPSAANFFQAQYDEYVDQLNAQFDS